MSNVILIATVCITDFGFRLDKQLKEMEASHHIHCRWSQSCLEFKEAERAYSKLKEQQLVELMWATSSRRQFLLKLKARYAGRMINNI